MKKYPSKKQFRESLNATCKNNQWSWSWVNHAKKKVYFGVSTIHEKGTSQLILGKNWQTNDVGGVKHGYPEAIQNIAHIKEDGYELLTFRQVEELKDERTGRVKIVSFDQELESRLLIEKPDGWYAILASDFDNQDDINLSDDLMVFIEGSRVPISGSKIERNSQARAACLKIHKHSCGICNFNFEDTYGELGKDFIHVHHLKPVSQSKGRYVINPKTDLLPVCPNCHAMIHRNGKNRSIAQIKKLIADNSK